MQTVLRKRAWSPYAVGALIGVLSWFAFASANKPLGITSAFENTAALLNQQLLPKEAAANSYYSAPEKSPKIDWEWMLVAGVFLGSMLSARLSGDHTKERAPALWRSRFGSSVGKRYAAAFLGGAIMMFGARVAQGCTSGHGISGALQLAVSSWIFVVVLFGVAVATSFLLYGQKGGIDHV